VKAAVVTAPAIAPTAARAAIGASRRTPRD
jgi:hypothetical protein